MKTKRHLIYCITMVVILFLALGAVSILSRFIFKEDIASFRLQNYCYVNATAQLLLGLIAIRLMKRNNVYEKAEFSAKGIGKGLYLGLVAIIYAFAAFGVNIIGNINYLQRPHLLYFLACVFIAFTTGLFEETLLRGFTLKYLYMYHPDMSIKSAIVLSAVIFGLLHFVNLPAWTLHAFVSTAVQVISSIILGIYLGIVFVRSGNLWSAIILHALIDGAMFILYSILSPEAFKAAAQSQTGGFSIMTAVVVPLAVMLPFLISSIVMSRKISSAPFQKLTKA